jgi:hypothetical protein
MQQREREREREREKLVANIAKYRSYVDVHAVLVPRNTQSKRRLNIDYTFLYTTAFRPLNGKNVTFTSLSFRSK